MRTKTIKIPLVGDRVDKFYAEGFQSFKFRIWEAKKGSLLIVPNKFHKQSVIFSMNFNGEVIKKINCPILSFHKEFEIIFLKDFICILERKKYWSSSSDEYKSQYFIETDLNRMEE